VFHPWIAVEIIIIFVFHPFPETTTRLGLFKIYKPGGEYGDEA
jgi:hypothetical protein